MGSAAKSILPHFVAVRYAAQQLDLHCCLDWIDPLVCVYRQGLQLVVLFVVAWCVLRAMQRMSVAAAGL